MRKPQYLTNDELNKLAHQRHDRDDTRFIARNRRDGTGLDSARSNPRPGGKHFDAAR